MVGRTTSETNVLNPTPQECNVCKTAVVNIGAEIDGMDVVDAEDRGEEEHTQLEDTQLEAMRSVWR